MGHVPAGGRIKKGRLLDPLSRHSSIREHITHGRYRPSPRWKGNRPGRTRKAVPAQLSREAGVPCRGRSPIIGQADVRETVSPQGRRRPLGGRPVDVGVDFDAAEVRQDV